MQSHLLRMPSGYLGAIGLGATKISQLFKIGGSLLISMHSGLTIALQINILAGVQDLSWMSKINLGLL